MKPIKKIQMSDSSKLYDYINMKIVGFISEENNWLANLANITAILKHLLDDVNWVGFYLIQKNELILGPFQGQPACTRILVGKGVCGKAVDECQTKRIENVDLFVDHIACDENSKSEIVIPIKYRDIIVGVLDIDSPNLSRFKEEDQIGLEKIVHSIEKYLDFDEILNLI